MKNFIYIVSDNIQNYRYLRFLIMLVVLTAVFLPLKGQEYSYYTQYMFNKMAINPAYACVHNTIGISGNIREQWVGVEGAPSTQTLSGFSPIWNERFGLGVNFVNDRVGVRSQQEVSVSYAYKLKFPEYTLSLGLKVGAITLKNNYRKLYVTDEDDDSFILNSKATLPIVGFGSYLKAKNYYLGMSVPQLYRFVSKKQNDYKIEQQPVILLTGGYLYSLHPDFKVLPSVFAKTQIGGVFEMDLNTNFYYKDDYCIGISYKSLNTLAIILEIAIDKSYYIGYSYDIATSKLISYQAGTHEISLNVYLNTKKKTGVVNPRPF
ncbi:MAG: PorP/SprF family type IX secretion system membrane protein [Bacteroidales bacterium]|nr:PorP/SprF family type IX secretion system membrane protein [Bacteroidales bacterium]